MLPVRFYGNASRQVGCRVALTPTLIRRALPITSKIPLQKPTSCDQARSQSTSTTGPTHPEVIFSGIQPTGVPHLGNYLGALKQWVDLQNSAPPSTELLYCVVDLHAITQPQDPNDLRRRRQDTMAMLLAVGLKAERCVIFEQSRVAAHSQLMWVLSTLAPTNLLARQTQWKSKLAESEDRSPLDPDGSSKLKLGLFSYPVLQAADILLYGTTLVPVGEDQVQHLELARSLAGKFNRTFGEILVVPRIKLAPAKRVMSLVNPNSKMSKSGKVNSQINLDHPEDEIRRRIRGSLTDSIPGISYDREARPGVSNLVEILGNMTSRDDFGAIAKECEGLSMKEFKDRVADSVVEGLKGIAGEYERIKGDAAYLEEVSRMGTEKANRKANETLEKVMNAMGMGTGALSSSL
ncbi:Tryptophan--tRNA ligase, mitochondrial [Arthrobotrys megalospora]